PLAESPRMRVMQNTFEVPGQTEIKYSEQGKEVTGPFQNIGVKVSAPKTSLLKRETEPLDVTCFGLQRIQQDVPLDVVTTGVVNMSGGNTQHFDIHPSDVRADGTYPRNFTITAQEAGTFSVTATVTWTKAPGGATHGGPSGEGPISRQFDEGVDITGCQAVSCGAADTTTYAGFVTCAAVACGPSPCSCKVYEAAKGTTERWKNSHKGFFATFVKFDNNMDYACFCTH